jgi:uncharacterized surface protein with fasciclin (FAS1) repeats
MYKALQDLDPTRDIVETAASAGRFHTLVTAVKASGLAETLHGAGPFTRWTDPGGRRISFLPGPLFHGKA